MKNKNKYKYKQDIEPQEIFLDNLAQRKEKEFGVSERKLEVPVSGKILKGFLFFIIFILFVFLAKTFHFQILENEKYLALANENKFIFHSIKSSRGVIYDSNGEQLVFNKPGFDLVLNPDKLPEDETKKERILKEAEEITKGEYQNLDYQTLIILETKINDLPGFEIKYNEVRYYKQGLLFSHLLGYTGKVDQEYIGRDGIEKSYEHILKKNPGKIRIERNAQGDLLSKEIIDLPQSGKSLVLWLDSGLQKKIKQVLEKGLKNTGAEKAVAIALDPKTGGVLALVSLPSYDNNLFSKGADQESLKELLSDSKEPLFNRVVSGLYATGSTIKPLIAAAALQEEIISPNKQIFGSEYIEIPHKYNPDIVYRFHDWRAHGWVDMQKAIAQSSNIYFYTIGGGYGKQEGLGPSRIKKYVELFGWGNKTGIDLPGEAEGLIPYPDWKKEIKKENWWDGDTYNLSIGQGDISVTPLQVAAAFTAIANGGTLLKPKLVKEILDNNKTVIKELSSEILRKDFIDPENLEVVRQGMRMAVTGERSPYASSILLNSLAVPVAAKTGTAQTPIKNYYHNWITVFGPYENPEIVLVVMIENVKNLQAAALPAAKEILEYYF